MASNDKNESSSSVGKIQQLLCKNCSKPCLEKDQVKKNKELQYVTCEACGDSYHKMCTDIQTKEWDLVTGSNESILFKCPPCIVNKGKKYQEMTDLKNEIGDVKTELKDEMSGVRGEVSGVKEEVSNLRALILENNNSLIRQLKEAMYPEVEEMIDRKLKDHAAEIDKKIDEKFRSFEEKNNKTVDEKMSQKMTTEIYSKSEQVAIEDKIQKQVSQSFDEMKEREERKLNLIFFNIKESTKKEKAEAFKEDIEKVKEVLSHTNPDLSENIVKDLQEDKMTRLGNKDDSNDQTKRPRPIKLTLKNEKTKFKILKNSSLLKNFQSQQNVGIKPDLTKQQQIEDKELRAQLKRRKDGGEDVMIYRNKVILREDHAKLKSEYQQQTQQSANSTNSNDNSNSNNNNNNNNNNNQQ